MVGEVASNFTSVEVLGGAVGNMITVLKVVGGVFGVVVIYWAIMTFINARRIKVLEKMLKNLEEINENIAKLAGSKGIKK